MHMMSKILFTTLVFLLVGISPSFAKNHTLLLWYPGAEGSAEQAAPLLETWTDYLTQKGLPVKIEAIYQNHPVDGGTDIIKKLKPAVGIISLEAFLYVSKKYPLTLLAQTRKQPAGDGSSQYLILQNKTAKESDTLYLSEPLTEDFARNIVLHNSPAYRNLPLQYAKQILRTLKKIGSGELQGAALLNSYEEAVLSRMKTPWSTQLKKVASSPKLPAPPVVLFEKWQKDFPHEKFVSLLLEMEKDPEGMEILEELRMQGFMKPNTANYEVLRNNLEAP
jgi:hypothetical protein